MHSDFLLNNNFSLNSLGAFRFFFKQQQLEGLDAFRFFLNNNEIPRAERASLNRSPR